MAARKGETSKLRGYKMAGADLNTKNMSQNTALHMAADTGQVQLTLICLDLEQCYDRQAFPELIEKFGQSLSLDLCYSLSYCMANFKKIG